MDTTQCIDNATWERYAAKTLSPAQLLSVQQHVEVCELCADIKEGIDAMAHPEALGAVVEEINAEVDEYLKPRRSKTLALWYWSAAAAIVITVGISLLFVNNNPVPIADKPQGPENQEQQVIAATPDTGRKEIAQALPGKKVPVAVPEIKQPEQTEKKQAPIQQDIDEDNAGIDDFAPFRGNTYNATGNATEEVPMDMDLTKTDTGQRKSITYKLRDTVPDTLAMLAKTTTDKINYTFDFGEKDVNAVGSTTEIKKQFTTSATLPANMSNNYTIFNNNATNNIITYAWVFPDSAYYNNALSFFNQKKYDSCLQNLEAIAYTVTSEYYEDALMLKAQTYMNQNRKAEAKEVLRTIVGLKKKRHKEAKRLMKALE